MMAVTAGLSSGLLTAKGTDTVDTVHAKQQDLLFNTATHQLLTSSTETIDGKMVNSAEKVQASFKNGVLTVTGTGGADSLRFLQSNGWFGLQGGAIGWFSASKVKSVVVNLGGGDDYVSLDSVSNGGQQSLSSKYTVNSGAGNETVHLANGNDVSFSGSGHQLVTSSTGTTTLDGQEVGVDEKLQASYKNGVLTVTGTSGDDDLRFLQSNGWFGLQGGVIGWYSASTVQSVVINLGGGDDYVSLASLSNGGQQALSSNYTINSGAGNETVCIPNGNEVVFSGTGHQLVASSQGAVTLDGQAVGGVEKIQASYSNGVLTVTGTSGDDDLRFLQSNGWFGLQGGAIGWYSASTVQSVVINLGGGDDYVTLESLSNGGKQALSSTYTVNSGAGNETVRLANGNDVSFSGTGHQLVTSSTGTTTLDGQVLDFGDPNPPPATNWFDDHVNDAALRALGHDLYLDNLIDRDDMIELLRNTEDGSVIDATELADLRSIVAATSLFGSLDYVDALASYIANGSVANAKYQGSTLGNLSAGSSSAQLEKLVNKWFFGLDRPTAGGTYRQAAGQLFVYGAAYTDIKQGMVGDCYFMMSLAETALRNPSAITNMFVANGDSTYTVRFYNNSHVEYVTVDSYLPSNNAGQLIYANMGAMYSNSNNELWTALAEKAYVQMNEMGFIRPGLSGNGQNSYAAIDSGYIYAALGQITGEATSAFSMTDTNPHVANYNFTTFVNAYNQGKSIGFASKTAPASSTVVGSHAYAVVGYNSANQTITLFNPWGTQYPLVTMTWSEIQGSFYYFDRTV